MITPNFDTTSLLLLTMDGHSFKGYPKPVPGEVTCLRCPRVFKSPDKKCIRICNRCKANPERFGLVGDKACSTHGLDLGEFESTDYRDTSSYDPEGAPAASDTTQKPAAAPKSPKPPKPPKTIQTAPSAPAILSAKPIVTELPPIIPIARRKPESAPRPARKSKNAFDELWSGF